MVAGLTPERVFLKLGGSLITDKTRPYTARPETLSRLGREIREALETRPGMQLVIGHGSGSFGHVMGQQHRTREGVQGPEGWRGYAATGRAAAQLNRLVCDALWEAGVPVLALQPSASARCRDGRLEHLELGPILAALAGGLTPLVFGDVALDDVRGGTIVSTEEIFAYLAPHLRPTRLLLAGRTAGVFTADPHRDPDAALLPRLTPAQALALGGELGGSHGADVTGGMWSKVQEVARLVQALPGLRAQIFSGERPSNVRATLKNPTSALGTMVEG
ncbi:MAG: isopentenyl phosphate kinase family protein [Chloroflexi bacterium]|nr:isopentenyl phosphate kinase family protein [Chloroflexota bacterium]